MQELSSNDRSARERTESSAMNMPPLVSIRSSTTEVYPPHLLAQKLTNRASYLLTIRKYDEGIVLLTKALKLTEQNIFSANLRKPCPCKSCSLEFCLSMGQVCFSSLMEIEKKEHDVDKNRYKNNDTKDDENENGGENDDAEDECDHDESGKEYERKPQDKDNALAGIENQDGFVYRRPFLVPRICIEEGHYMGVSLSLIILYNLALAHHLEGISMITPSQSEPDEFLSRQPPSKAKMQVLKQALQLYELAYQLHMDYIERPDAPPTGKHNRNVGSLRFTMIVSNNLGEIHREARNPMKHKMCLQHLLSAIMYMVDCNLVILDSSEMDGFYQNLSPIMLSDICAKAA